MSRTKKIIIAAISITASLAASISGLFLTFFVIGKKIDEAYSPKQKQDNEEYNN
ncbi:hypothetical protein AB4027_04150 [Alkalibacterium putridalgicola]|uniref:Uncharacterized protein n=1 Tax=Alkalibacterium putridalgicola TaxID=426703 RepID=A0A1H7XJ53_9LACT|nr:hypothetical protein [Alkalibacterium putridalgicola]GEK90292.1 hypothetical protein APU01nite_23310 [Alkalibacterium putridalgicola]SEM33238.1 hypothetical protein SAMN04488100_1528 [Alkalibacterium putridalgicola]